MEQTIDLKKLQNELKKIKSTMITKQEMNSFLETISIVSNEDTMRQIQNSEQDIKDGKTREVNTSNDLRWSGRLLEQKLFLECSIDIEKMQNSSGH